MIGKTGFLVALAISLMAGSADAQLSADTSVGGGSVSVGAGIGGADVGTSVGGTDDSDGDDGGFGAAVGVEGRGDGRVDGSGSVGRGSASFAGSASDDGSGSSDSSSEAASTDAGGADSGDVGASDGSSGELAATEPVGSTSATGSAAVAASADVDGDGRLTVDELDALSPEERLLIIQALSKRDFRRLARGCRHSGVEAELRGTCAYFSDYLR